MRIQTGLFTVLALGLLNFSIAQNLDFDFVKNALNYTDEELNLNLTSKKFKLIEKEHKNMGDKLINKSEYYSNKTEGGMIESGPETAIFVNGKRSKKTVFISFNQNIAFDNFNSLETEIKKAFKKEAVLQSEKYESAILKYSNDKTFYYLFKEEETYYIIISASDLEESYFNSK